MRVTTTGIIKSCSAPGYNYKFNLKTGFFARWGTTEEEDPAMAPAPEILDIEIATACLGTGTPCPFCYKANGPRGDTMSFQTFKALFDKVAPIHTVLLRLEDGTRVELSADHPVFLVGGSIKRAADLEVQDDIHDLQLPSQPISVPQED